MAIRIRETKKYARRQKLFEKKYPRELESMLDNLEMLRAALENGMQIKNKPYGFMHYEPNGVVAIDQKGYQSPAGKKGGHSRAQTRLYVYFDEVAQVLYHITIGDKTTQHTDIEDCKTFINLIRSQTIY